MEITKPKDSDREQIIKILRENLSAKYMPEMMDELERVINGKQDGFVAINENNNIIGYITCVKTMGVYKLETLALDKTQHGKGIGKQLVSHLEEYLIRTIPPDEDKVVINVVTDDAANDPVQEFYKRCGYGISGIVNNEFGLGDRQVHLTKVIEKKKTAA